METATGAGMLPAMGFDERAVSYDNPYRAARAEAIAATTASRWPGWQPSTLLDLGCGTGTVCLSLTGHFPSLSTVIGIDPSGPMRDVFASKVEGWSRPRVVLAADLDDLAPDLPSPDLVVCCLALHHIEDAVGTISRLAGLLPSGGRLVCAEFEAGPGLGHPPTNSHVPHDGFLPDTLASWFSGSGLDEVGTWHVIDGTNRDGSRHRVFAVGGIRR